MSCCCCCCLRLNDNTEYKAFMMRQRCRQKRRAQSCSFNAAGRHYAGPERETVEFEAALSTVGFGPVLVN